MFPCGYFESFSGSKFYQFIKSGISSVGHTGVTKHANSYDIELFVYSVKYFNELVFLYSAGRGYGLIREIFRVYHIDINMDVIVSAALGLDERHI